MMKPRDYWIAWILASAALLWHTTFYLPFLTDDALISFRFAERLAAGNGLTFTDGERVEGYSNLLWVLIITLGSIAGFDLVAFARAIGYLCMFGALGAITFAHWNASRNRSCATLAMALGSFSLATPIAAWCIAGLEQPLVALALSWTLATVTPILRASRVAWRDTLVPGFGLGVLCLTRPDGPLFTAAMVLAILVARSGQRWVTSLRIAAIPAAATVAQLLFRLAYYGTWIPNTAHAKISGSAHHLALGTEYLSQGAFFLLPLSAVAIAIVCHDVYRNRLRGAATLAIASSAAIWTVYLAYVGGDAFLAWRHFVPLVVCMAMVLAIRLDRIGWRWTRPAGTTLVVVLTLTSYLAIQSLSRKNRGVQSFHVPWVGKEVGGMLKRGFGDLQPTIACDSIGAVPYWSELPTLDMLGLCDRHIALNPPSGFGDGWVGHELGDGEYVLRRRPDIVNFSGPYGREVAVFRSGIEMQADPSFLRDYTLAHFGLPAPSLVQTRLWIRRYSELIGIKEEASRILVPSYLITPVPAAKIQQDSEGQFYFDVRDGQGAVIERVTAQSGVWVAEAPLGCEVLLRRSRGEKLADPWTAEVSLESRGEFDLRIRSSAERATRIYDLQILRR